MRYTQTLPEFLRIKSGTPHANENCHASKSLANRRRQMSSLSDTCRRQYRHTDAFRLNLNCAINQLLVFKPSGQIFNLEPLLPKQLCKHFTGEFVSICARGKTQNTPAERRNDSGEVLVFLLICAAT